MIIDFNLGKCPDSEGRFIGEIHSWDNEKLEHVHDYIQWLFPLREPSPFNPHAPVLSEYQIATFRSDPALKTSLLKSFDAMLQFYGFSRSDRTVATGPDWERRRREWMTPWNHNYRRITRILKSMNMMGLEVYAEAFFAALQMAYHGENGRLIGEHTFRFWEQAASIR